MTFSKSIIGVGASPVSHFWKREKAPLPLNARAMAQLHEEHAIYGTPEGCVNLAGLTTVKIGQFAKALVSACQDLASEVPLC